MNWDQIKRNWPLVSNEILVTWGKLSMDDLDKIAGRRDQLTSYLQMRYGYEKELAERKVDDFAERMQVSV